MTAKRQDRKSRRQQLEILRNSLLDNYRSNLFDKNLEYSKKKKKIIISSRSQEIDTTVMLIEVKILYKDF